MTCRVLGVVFVIVVCGGAWPDAANAADTTNTCLGRRAPPIALRPRTLTREKRVVRIAESFVGHLRWVRSGPDTDDRCQIAMSYEMPLPKVRGGYKNEKVRTPNHYAHQIRREPIWMPKKTLCMNCWETIFFFKHILQAGGIDFDSKEFDRQRSVHREAAAAGAQAKAAEVDARAGQPDFRSAYLGAMAYYRVINRDLGVARAEPLFAVGPRAPERSWQLRRPLKPADLIYRKRKTWLGLQFEDYLHVMLATGRTAEDGGHEVLSLWNEPAAHPQLITSSLEAVHRKDVHRDGELWRDFLVAPGPWTH